MSLKQKLKNRILLWMKEVKEKQKVVYERNRIVDPKSIQEHREEMLAKYYDIFPRGM